jgi:hypothetical protein
VSITWLAATTRAATTAASSRSGGAARAGLELARSVTQGLGGLLGAHHARVMDKQGCEQSWSWQFSLCHPGRIARAMT